LIARILIGDCLHAVRAKGVIQKARGDGMRQITIFLKKGLAGEIDAQGGKAVADQRGSVSVPHAHAQKERISCRKHGAVS
jgi:hypothetical protein